MNKIYITKESLINKLRDKGVRYNRHETEERTLITYTGADKLVFRFSFYKQDTRIDWSITLPCFFERKGDPWSKADKTNKLSGSYFTNEETAALDFTVEMRIIKELHKKIAEHDFTL